ncbi:uncharacterized protein ACWYII_040019 [Salvelinus alpinus]
MWFFRNILLHSLLAIAYVNLCIGQHCPSCPQERYTVKNCSQLDGGWTGPSCILCSDCRGEGKITFSSCSTFSDTVCGCKDGYNISSMGDCQKHESLGPTQLPLDSVGCMRSIAIVIVTLVVLVFIISILSMALICLRKKVYKKGAHQKLTQCV